VQVSRCIPLPSASALRGHRPGHHAARVEAGQVIFGEPDTRFTEFVGLLLETVARLRVDGSRAVIQ
jgi:hypothetical protein